MQASEIEENFCFDDLVDISNRPINRPETNLQHGGVSIDFFLHKIKRLCNDFLVSMKCRVV